MLGWRSLALCACVLALSSCASDPSAPVDEPDVSLVLVSGDGQSGPAGQELPQPLIAEVRTAGGAPVPDMLVNFRVVSGGGRPFAGAARTNAQGRVQDYWTLGPVAAQPQVMEVRAVRGGNKRVYATFSATALAPSAP